MPPRLTIFQNNPDGTPEDQFKDINLALTNVNEWAKKIANNAVSFKDDTAQSTTSTGFTTLPGYTQIFSSQSPLIRYDLSLNITSPGTTTITVSLDGELIKTVTDAVNANHLVYMTDTLNTYTGQHTLEVQWKTSTGTLTKNLNGGSSLVITSLI